MLLILLTQMHKTEIKAFLLSSTSPSSPSPSLALSAPVSAHSPSTTPTHTALPSLATAIAHFKHSLQKVREAEGRSRVLERQLEKQKSTTLNAKRHSDYADYIQHTTDLDKYLQQWNSANWVRRIQQQSLLNRQSRRRIKDNINNSRSFLHSNKAQKRYTLFQQTQINEQAIRNNQEEMINSRIKLRKREQKEQRRRQQEIAAFHQRKQYKVRREKERQIQNLFSQSLSNHATVNRIVQRNHSLKHKKHQQEEVAHKLNTQQLPINLASTIKNPQIYAQ